MPPARRVPLDPEPSYRVAFAPELVSELHGFEEMDEVVLELETTLSLRLEDIPGRRIEKVEDADDLLKYRPHAANDTRFLFATLEDQKLRIVLSSFPRKNDYRRKDLKTAAARLRRFLESVT